MKLDSNNYINNKQISNELKNRLLQALESSKSSILNNKEEDQIEFKGITKSENINENNYIADYAETQQLISKLKLEVLKLNQLFWTKEELDELQFAVNFFEARIQNMIQATLRNLEWYQNEGWKKFLNKEDELQ